MSGFHARTARQLPVASADAVNVLVVGDAHFESPGFPWSTRLAICAADLSRMIGRAAIHAAVQVGDSTTQALPVEFDAYKAWAATISLPVPLRTIPGNHDLIGNNSSGTPDLMTPAQWAATMGQPAKDTVVDVGDRVRLLLISPAADATTGQAKVRRLTVDAATIAWLDARIGETTRQCLVFFHAPLASTVGPLDGTAFSSYDERWRAHHDSGAGITDLIARHPNVVAWVSGHTHSRVDEVDVVKRVTHGSTTFAAVSAGSPAFWNPSAGPLIDPIITCVVTVLPYRVEVRYRDCGAHQWLAPVHTVLL